MDNQRYNKLIELEPEELANTLLKLAQYCDHADELIEQLISTPNENIQRFKKKLASIKRSDHFINWYESTDFAEELELLLADLKASIDDPYTRLELLATFYQADSAIFDRCDDSNGCVGDVFRYDAQILFVEFAKDCKDKEKIIELILKILTKNEYGARDTLLDNATQYLPEASIRKLISKFEQRLDKTQDKGDSFQASYAIESLARQIKVPKLFERIRTQGKDKVPSYSCIDIAQVYFESDDIDNAYLWLNNIPEQESFKQSEKDELLIKIYQRQGNKKQLHPLLYKQFHKHRCADTLEALLDIVGHENKKHIIQDEIEIIQQHEQLSILDTQFMLEQGHIDETEAYLLKRAEKLKGEYYFHLLPIAKKLESEKRFLIVCLIYRSLLNEILERGNSKAYYYAASYLKKLDQFAPFIMDWQGFDNHQAFTQQIQESHGRKRSFWAKYKE